MIKISHICKLLNGRKILSDVSFDLRPSEITVLIGPSGSGKSSLLRIIANIDKPTSGEVVYINAENGMNSDLLWPKITMVFQQLYLWPNMTLGKNILLPLELNGIEIDHIYFVKLTKLFEVEDILDRYPNQSSVGQQQRVALIRSLMLKPRYLLLDEITSSLDVEFANKVGELIKELKHNNCCILIVTHLLGFAKSIADQTVFIDKGTVVEIGNKEVLLNPVNERVRKFVGTL
ncbi:MAG: amino acid ABC transporter ATP-binding protein [Ignavibacteriae bacterium]|nr:amino acid ABC transporter ATP-binding protein [Ignavibacteriota bacterium]